MNRMLTLAALVLAVAAGAAQADTVWKWTGKDGKPAYGKQPPPGIKAEQVDVKAANIGSLASPVRGPASSTAGREQAAAINTMAPKEIDGVVVKNGSVRAARRAAGHKGQGKNPSCPPQSPSPSCRQKGDSIPSGPPPMPPLPPAVLKKQAQAAPGKAGTTR